MTRRQSSLVGTFSAVLCLVLSSMPPQVVPARADGREGGESPAVQAPSARSGEPGEQPAPPDLAALRRHIDAAVEAQLQEFDLPGAAVAVVQRGQVLHARGYGLADSETGRRFDSRTVLRTASVAKLFTATAVMQLVEQGLIDLDEDVGAYVDIPVPDTFAAPITMRHLLTHTAGFDDRLLGSSASKRRPADTLPLREFLTSRDAARRVRPPGQLISYSNHGMALAGQVVAAISGQSFEDYVDEHLHGPLKMTRSSFRDPPPPNLGADRAMAHRYRRERHEALPVTHENGAPAGSQFSTADDMARFMLANLGDGALDGARILAPATLRQMHATAFTHHPLLPGWTLGFIEYHWNGYRLIGHGGDLPGYHNQLSLLPDEQLGVFVHFNGIWEVKLDDDPRLRVVDAVLAALVPTDAGTTLHRTPDEPAGVLHAADGTVPVAGNYRITRYASTSMEKLLLPISFLRLHVREREGGALSVTMPLGLVQPSTWVPVGPLLYKRYGGDDYLAFSVDERGRSSHLYGTLMIPMAFERVRWYEGELVLLGLMAFSTLTFLGVIAGWAVRTRLRRLRRIPDPAVSPRRRRMALLARGAAILGATVMTVLVVMMIQVAALGDTPLLPWQPLLGVLSLACGLASAWLGIVTLWTWRRGGVPVAERLGRLTVAVAGVLFLWQMGYWNVLGL